MLNGCRLHNMELGVRLADDLPIAHIAVFRAVDLADGLLFDGDALHCLDGHDGRHANAAAGFDGLAERLGVNVVIDDARHMLLVDRLDCQAKLIANGFAGILSVGRLKNVRVRNPLLKLFWCQVAAMRICER